MTRPKSATRWKTIGNWKRPLEHTRTTQTCETKNNAQPRDWKQTHAHLSSATNVNPLKHTHTKPNATATINKPILTRCCATRILPSIIIIIYLTSTKQKYNIKPLAGFHPDRARKRPGSSTFLEIADFPKVLFHGADPLRHSCWFLAQSFASISRPTGVTTYGWLATKIKVRQMNWQVSNKSLITNRKIPSPEP